MQLALFDDVNIGIDYLENRTDEELFNLGAVANIGTEILKQRGYSETDILAEYARRSNPIMISYIRGNEYNERKQLGGDTSNRQNVGQDLAKEFGVSRETIKRDAKLADAIDHIDEVSHELKEEIISGDSGFTKKDIIQISELEEEVILEVASGKTVIATLHTGDNESYTPGKYIDSARVVMGGIDVDPASNDFANEKVNASIYYTEETNGLDKNWLGNVWINPPYAYPLIGKFIDKLIEELENGNCEDAVLLTNNSADTKWFHKASAYATAICFTKGRINFYKADESTTSPTNGQTFFYFGDNIVGFTDEFKQYGMIVEVIEDAV